jgi:SOS response regulatory protein OraA/RecX
MSDNRREEIVREDMLKTKKKSALEKIVDYLSIRDHSENEIRTKLSRNEFEPEEIEDSIELAQEQGLILEPKKLAENVSEQLNRKSKGILYINQYLESKGLPCVPADWELEFAKAKTLILKRFSKNPPYTIEEKQDIYRYLTNRGYADQTVNQVIHATNL